MGGDFNSHISNLNQLHKDIIPNNLQINNKRLNCDKKLDNRGIKLVESMENNGFIVLNGRSNSDSPAKYTFINSLGKSTIDMVWSNFLGLDCIDDFEVCIMNSNSDHFPIRVNLIEGIDYNENVVNTTLKWKKECTIYYYNLMSGPPENFVDSTDVNVMEKNLIDHIYDTATNLGIRINKKNVNGTNPKAWYDNECWNCKKEVNNLLKACKNNNFESETLVADYIEKKLYKNLQRSKKEAYKNFLLNEISVARDSSTFWKLVNNFRFRRCVGDEIGLNEWHTYLRSTFPKKAISLMRSQAIVTSLLAQK